MTDLDRPAAATRWSCSLGAVGSADPKDYALSPEELARACAAPRVLAPGGGLYLEIDLGQAEATRALLQAAGFVEVAARRDLAGIDRVVAGRRAEAGEPGLSKRMPSSAALAAPGRSGYVLNVQSDSPNGFAERQNVHARSAWTTGH